MFTGIIEEVGEVTELTRLGDSLRITVSASTVLEDVSHGDSIAVNGVCLTVTDYSSREFSADVMQVSLDYTTLGELEVGQPVNLERALASGARYGGHVVQGHVDGTATLLARTASEHWEVFRFRLDAPELGAYTAKKGSIAVNGTSLTLAEVAEPHSTEPGWFEVSLIPTTLEETMLGSLNVGSRVNIECDVLAKYVERLAAFS